MATLQSLIESHREGAEVYTGAQICKEKSRELLSELHLPRGLIQLTVMEEVGYNRATGFVWLRQAKTTDLYLKKIKKHVTYAPLLTAFVEDRKMKRMTGVKSKEMLIWMTVSEMSIDNPASGKIVFRTPSGLWKSLPVDAFEVEEEEKADEGK